MTTFFEHQRTSYKRNYLKNLIGIASTDGVLDVHERSLIVRIGLMRGLKKWQIEEILDDRSPQEIFLPESHGNQMNMLYDLMQIIHADSKVDEKEVAFLVNIVASFKLNPQIIVPLMLLFENGTPNRDEWATFVDFISTTWIEKEKAA